MTIKHLEKTLLTYSPTQYNQRQRAPCQGRVPRTVHRPRETVTDTGVQPFSIATPYQTKLNKICRGGGNMSSEIANRLVCPPRVAVQEKQW